VSWDMVVVTVGPVGSGRGGRRWSEGAEAVMRRGGLRKGRGS